MAPHDHDPMHPHDDEPHAHPPWAYLAPHRLPGPAIPAIVLERENRFVARCQVGDTEIRAHVPDRGRLVDLVFPGAKVLLFASGKADRSTTHSLLVAEDPKIGVLVAIDPAGANARVRPLLERAALSWLEPGWTVRSEVTYGHSRFDYELSRGKERFIIEVKSVGAARDGIALFPDAPTERGRRHLEELVDLSKKRGTKAAVLFVAQRADVHAIRADHEIDPAFAKALAKARKKIAVYGVSFAVSADGCRFLGEVPVLE